ncbi:hypothetical protein FHW69_001626 [Luteibacter sp. Sphag1AF]|nr:hypothetical protein [Luteibacter sp. Sphag1AF]
MRDSKVISQTLSSLLVFAFACLCGLVCGVAGGVAWGTLEAGMLAFGSIMFGILAVIILLITVNT